MTSSRPEPDGALERPPAAGGRATPTRIGAERLVLWLSAAVAVLAPTVAAVDVAVPGRSLLALAFVLMVPGVPLASLLGVPSRLLSGSLAGALSIAVTVLTATFQVLTGWWQPVVTSAVVGALSVVATGWALERHSIPRAAPLAGRVLPRARPSARMASLAVLALAVGLWWSATRLVDLDDAGALGLIGVVGWPYVVALALVAAVTAHQLLRRRLDGVVLAAAAVVLTVVVYGFSNVADGQAGVSVGWLHVGFIRFITEHQASFLGLDARAYWPGFFAAGAVLVRLAGTPDASTFLSLAPVFYNVAAIAPLLVIARCVTRSRRLAWFSVFVYLGGNWFQQDYFSPQATALLLYLTTIALLLWTVSRTRTPPIPGPWGRRALQAIRRRPELPPGVTARQALCWEVALVVLAAAVVVAHQLTPVTLVFALLAFTVTGHTRYRRLWLVVALCFLGWFVYAGTGYWIGHLGTVLGDLGAPGSNLDSAVGSRVSGEPTYQLMQKIRLGWSLLYALAGAAGWWLVRHRREAPVVAGLVAGAGVLVLLGSYGGEVVLRTFVFAAPLLAPLSTLLIYRVSRSLLRRRGLVRGVALIGTLLLLSLAVTTTRGVNIAFERVTADDVAAAQAVYERLRPGDVVGDFASTGSLGMARVGEVQMLQLSEATCGRPLADCARAKAPDFIMTGRTQDESGQLTAGQRPGWTTAVIDTLVDRGIYRVIYQGADAEVLQLVVPGG